VSPLDPLIRENVDRSVKIGEPMGIFRRSEDALGKARREAEHAGEIERAERVEVGEIGTVGEVETGGYSAPKAEAPVPRAPAPSRSDDSPDPVVTSGDPRGWQGAPGPFGGGGGGGTVGGGFPVWLPLAVVGIVLAVGFGVISQVMNAVDDVDFSPSSEPAPTREIPAQPDTPGLGEARDGPESRPSPAPSAPSSPTDRPQAPSSGGGSLVTPERFGKALVRIRREGSRALTLRIANDRIDAQILGESSMKIVQVTPDLKLRTIATTGNRPPVPGVDLRAIRSGTPARLVRLARDQGGGAGLDYLVTTGVVANRSWSIFLKGGRAFTSQGDGGPVRRIG